MNTVMIFGVFDGIHLGHQYVLVQARGLAGPEGKVVVSVALDHVVKRIKGELPHFTTEQRRHALQIQHDVDLVVVPPNNEDYIEQIKNINPDIIALGYDQNNEYTESLEIKLKEANITCNVVRLKAFEPDTYHSSKIAKV